MSKNGTIKSIISSELKKKSNNNFNKDIKNEIINKIYYRLLKKKSASSLNDLDINKNNYSSESSNNIAIHTKNTPQKTGASSNLHFNKIFIISSEKSDRNKDNIINQNCSDEIYKNLSTKKEIFNSNNKYFYDTYNNKYSFNTCNSQLINSYPDKDNEIKYKSNNKDSKKDKKNVFNKNNNYGKNKHKYKKIININSFNKKEKFLSTQPKENKNNKRDKLSFLGNKTNNNINNLINRSYINTNSNSKNIIKKINFDQIKENSKSEKNGDKVIKKPSIEILKSIRGNLMAYYNFISGRNINEMNNTIKKNKGNIDNTTKNNQIKKNIIDFILQKKEKSFLNNGNNKNKIGNLQNLVIKNDEETNQKNKANTQMNNTNKNNINIKNDIINSSKNMNKSKFLRNNKNIYNKNKKRDLTLNNLEVKKKGLKYFDFINNYTNTFGNNIKDKNIYLNLIRKSIKNKNNNDYNYSMNNKNNINKKNKYNEFLSPKNNNKIKNNYSFVQKPERDFKSLSKEKNKSNTKKFSNINHSFLNNLIKKIENKEKKIFYSVNENIVGNKNIIKKSYQNNTKNNTDNSQNLNSAIEEIKIKENLLNNCLNTYSIFISHKYYKNINKIGLKKIRIFDTNDNEIPVMFYQTNGDYDNGILFNAVMTNINMSNKSNIFGDEILKKNIPFITEVKKDIYIYFHINNNLSNNIKYIQIINYNNNDAELNSVKYIEIYKGQELKYKGILNNNINIIDFSNNNKTIYYNKLNYINNINNNKIHTKLKNNTNNNKNKIGIYYTSRNNLYKELYHNTNEKEFKDNNNKLYSKIDGDNINENENLSQKKFSKNNTINIHINNNTNNITNLGFFENNENIDKGNKLNYLTMQNSSESYIHNEIDNNNIENINDNNFNSNDNKIMNNINMKINESFDKNNSKNDYNNKNIKETNNNETINNNSNQNNIYYITTLYNTVPSNNYISFNKIKFIITSNYGHKKYVGLTGIKFYNIRGDLINVETADSIGAFPKDLRTIFDDEYDNRIFENVFNEEYNTNDVDHMWVTKLRKREPKSFIELSFSEKIKISKIKFYNYNEKNNLHIGAKTIELYLDDNYYGTIYLKPGVGEKACTFIKNNFEDIYKINPINVDLEDDDELNFNDDEDFGQLITFPIKNYEEKKNDFFDIKYTSFLYDEQCYETPFMPCGYYIKFQFLSNFNKGIIYSNEANEFKSKKIGLDSIEIYNNENINITSNKSLIKYKIISNCETVSKKDKLVLNGMQNENGNNCLFYIFDEPIQVSYIKFNPLTKNMKFSLNSVKEIKIYCESKIIFEGDLYLDHPTIALFTCDLKIAKNIDNKYLTQKVNFRKYTEIKNNEYYSLILN